jgi:NCAIR mutase (PurE)-related protein
VDEPTLRDLVDQIRRGDISPDAAVARLRRLPFASAADGAALVDHHRALRQGMPEAVYGPGKTPEHCADIVGELLQHGTGPVLLTRTDAAQRDVVMARHGAATVVGTSLAWRLPIDPMNNDLPLTRPRVLVITAGTADVPVADEAALTLCAHGIRPDRLHDVGVAGLHRLLAHLDRVMAADAVIVIAGMEGALASVMGGLAGGPVIAVPTSVGYGSGLDGVTALLAMHATCASGVTVVGVDNGFGAAVAMVRILRMAERGVTGDESPDGETHP